MYVRGIEAIKQYMPPTRTKISANIKEEHGEDLRTTEIMSSVDRYREEWAHLLKCLDDEPDLIREHAFRGVLRVSKFRSIYWSILLRVLSTDYRDWKEQREQQRNRYEKLKHEFIKDPHDVEGPDDNPLSQSEESVWNQYFSDQELLAIISQDVIRTFPGVDFFRKATIQNAMCNILFYYAREHPYMCYRQGMHEILAPILFVLYGDQQSLLHFSEIVQQGVHLTSEILLNVIDPNCLEADSYSLFSRLMSSIESYYRIKSFVQQPNGYFGAQDDSNQTMGPGVEVISQLNSIRERILAKEDLHLHNYLLKIDIPLHIFGIRWLRLLFGREFALLDLLVIWDAVFADSDRFDLPNYILVAMLIRIRDKLLLSDQTTCLTYLMRYPSNVDVNLILRHALHMLMPKKFDRPANAFVYFTANKKSISQLEKIPDLPSTSNIKIMGHSTSKQSINFFQTESSNKLQKTGLALSDVNFPKMEQNIAILQARNAADSAATSRSKNSAPDQNHSIVEGYSKNSLELINLELKNAQTVISVARSKLQAYMTTVRNHVSGKSSKELLQALDGIDELCNLLDVQFMFPIHAARPPIDIALEANEQVHSQKFNIKKPTIEKNSTSITGDLKTSTSVQPHNQLEALTKHVIDNATISEKTLIYQNPHSYERPDDNFLRKSTHSMGGLREIELITIAPSEYVVEPINRSQSTRESSQKYFHNQYSK